MVLTGTSLVMLALYSSIMAVLSLLSLMGCVAAPVTKMLGPDLPRDEDKNEFRCWKDNY